MRAGLLRDLILFLKPIPVDSEYSGREVGYTRSFCCRAQVVHNSGNKIVDGGEVFSAFTVKFTIHHYHKVSSNMIIEHAGSKYRILDINPRYAQQDIVITGEVIDE